MVADGAIAEDYGVSSLVHMSSCFLAVPQSYIWLQSQLIAELLSVRQVLAAVRKNVVLVQGVFSALRDLTCTQHAVGGLAT